MVFLKDQSKMTHFLVCANSVVQVEEKPDVTYSDVGGCKEQIEKLREVVETPLLHVSFQHPDHLHCLGKMNTASVLCSLFFFSSA